MKIVRTIEGDKGNREKESVSVSASDFFVAAPAIDSLTRRALMYLRTGYSVHLSGPAGTGKTTLAFHIAAQLGRPITLLSGDHRMTSSDLVGSAVGYRKMRVVDNYVRSVMRTEEHQTPLWSDNRLTSACRYGHTLVYDEFNRTPPEANNPLLSVLSERVLHLPKVQEGVQNYINVHKEFRAVFTSNPEEYVAVFQTADALLDRLVTLRVGHLDGATEAQIIARRSGIAHHDAEMLVALLCAARAAGYTTKASIRTGIAIARVLVQAGGDVAPDNPALQWASEDLLGLDPDALKGLCMKIERTSTKPEVSS